MQPKRFLHLYTPGMPYSIGAGEIAKRPELASLVGQCIALWNDIELQMALSLGAILKANSDAAVALFLAIKTSRTQKDALSAVARLLLSGTDLDSFEALLIVYDRIEKQRNKLAHGLFGVSDAIPDALLWSSLQDHANFLINVYVSEYRRTPLRDPHEKLRNDMYVYSREDLEGFLRDLMELHKAVMLFHFRHQPRGGNKHDYVKEMLSLPQLEHAMKLLEEKRAASSRQGCE